MRGVSRWAGATFSTRHAVAGLLAVAAATAVLRAQQPQLTREEQMIVSRSMEQPQASAYPIPMPAGVTREVLPVLGKVVLIAGAGQQSNTVVQVGEEGAFVVDAGDGTDTAQIVKAIGALTRGPISYIVTTSFDPEHYKGNEALGKAGMNPTLNQPNLTGPGTPAPSTAAVGQPGRQDGAIVFAHENTLNRMSAPTGETSAVPFGLWPSNTFFTLRKTVTFNDEPIELHHPPAAYTDGDVMVFFRTSDVLAVGDVINTYGYAPFDPKRGGSIAGVLSALNDVIDITIPRFNQMAGTRVVPGHGRILNEADVVEYRDMITIIHDRVKLGIEKGMTLAQIKAQQPTLDYDGLYSTPALSGDMYVELIYNDLKNGRSK